MIVNGNLKFHTLGDGELQNAILERLAVAPTGAAGRMYYDTGATTPGDKGYWFYDGVQWVAFATGGSTGTIQTEIDAIETTIGDMINTDGTANTGNMNALGNVSGAADLSDVLTSLDAAITAAAGVDNLADLTDVTITASAAGDLLYTTGANTWVNGQPAVAGVQPLDAGLTSLAGLAAVNGDIIYATAADTYAVAAPGATSGVQPYDAALAGIAGLATIADDQLIIGTGAGTYGYLSMSPYMQGLMDDVDEATFHASINLEIGTDVQAYDLALDNLSALAGTGFMVQTGADTFITTSLAASIVAGDQGISVTDASGVADAPTIGLDIVGLTAEAGTLSGTDVVALYDGTNNVKASVTQLAAGIVSAGVALDDLSDVDDTVAKTADLPAILMGDGTNLDTVLLAGGNDLTAVAVTGTSLTLNVDDSFLRNTGDTLDSGALSVASGASINVLTGGDISAIDAPASANDLTNKAYVDAAVAGLGWTGSIADPDLVGISADTPAGPTLGTGYIAYDAGAGLSTTGAWNSLGVIEYDYVYYSTLGVWSVVGNISSAVGVTEIRFGVAFEHGTADASLTAINIDDHDLVEYIAGVSGDPTLITSWSHPQGHAGGAGHVFTGVDVTVITKTFRVSGDHTLDFFPNNRFTVTGTTAADAEYTIDSVSYSAPNTSVVVNEVVAGSDQTVAFSSETEIFGGTTTLVSATNSLHNGHSYSYDEVNNVWNEVSGPGSVGAGTGLFYVGSTLNVGLGAGILELPSDEVGVDVHANGGLMTTVDNSAVSTLTGAQLAVMLDGTTLSKSASGLKVGTILNAQVDAAADITYAKMEPVASGSILVGNGGGTAAAAVVMSGDVTIIADGTTTIGSNAVDNSMLANDSITFTDGTTPTAVALGGTLTINETASTGINVVNTAGNFAISGIDATTAVKGVASFDSAHFTVSSGAVSLAASLSDLTDVAATVDGTADAAGSVLVGDGSTGYEEKNLQFIYSSVVAGDGGSGPSTSHTVTHNLGQQFVSVTVVDSTNSVIIPQSIVFTSTSVVTVTFNTSIDCRVVVMGVPGVAVTGV